MALGSVTSQVHNCQHLEACDFRMVSLILPLFWKLRSMGVVTQIRAQILSYSGFVLFSTFSDINENSSQETNQKTGSFIQSEAQAWWQNQLFKALQKASILWIL